MFKSVLVLVVLGLSGPQCPSGEEQAGAPPPADARATVDVPAESGPAGADMSGAEVGAADGAPGDAEAAEEQLRVAQLSLVLALADGPVRVLRQAVPRVSRRGCAADVPRIVSP